VSTTPPTPTWRRRLYRELEPAAREEEGLSRLNRGIIAAILISVISAVLESEPLVVSGRERLFRALDIGFGVLFLVEYCARLWTCVEAPRFGPGLRGRLRFARTPGALIDLFALLPLFVLAVGAEVYLLRMVRLLRVLRVARLGRFSRVLDALGQAVHSRRYELWMSVAIAAVLLLVSSTALYIVEGHVQPEQFGSIPRAMWWSVATLTTVGYGDSYPITVIGRAFAGVTALTGIGLIAMPTGILASAFSDALQRQRTADAARRAADGMATGGEEREA
jgi:voltage-gated potassium channel